MPLSLNKILGRTLQSIRNKGKGYRAKKQLHRETVATSQGSISNEQVSECSSVRSQLRAPIDGYDQDKLTNTEGSQLPDTPISGVIDMKCTIIKNLANSMHLDYLTCPLVKKIYTVFKSLILTAALHLIGHGDMEVIVGTFDEAE